MINLAALPPLTSYRSVTARAINIDARTALRVELEDTVATSGRPGIDYIDMPTFVVLPMAFAEGTISVDIRSRLNASAPDFTRAFAGIAYRISEDCKRFECVYIRPMNGLKANPLPPRDKRAVQYFAFPAWKFDRLRD